MKKPRARRGVEGLVQVRSARRPDATVLPSDPAINRHQQRAGHAMTARPDPTDALVDRLWTQLPPDEREMLIRQGTRGPAWELFTLQGVREPRYLEYIERARRRGGPAAEARARARIDRIAQVVAGRTILRHVVEAAIQSREATRQ